MTNLPEARTVFRLSPAASLQPTGEGAVILRIADGQLFTCNAVSEAFLSRLDGRADLAVIAAALSGEFDAEVRIILADLQEAAAMFLAEGLLEPVA